MIQRTYKYDILCADNYNFFFYYYFDKPCHQIVVTYNMLCDIEIF